MARKPALDARRASPSPPSGSHTRSISDESASAAHRFASRLGTAFAAPAGVLRNDDLRRVELAWGASIAAEWAHFVALGVFAYQVGGTLGVGVAGFVRLLPSALVAPFAA